MNFIRQSFKVCISSIAYHMLPLTHFVSLVSFYTSCKQHWVTETASFIHAEIWGTLPNGCNDIEKLKKDSWKLSQQVM